MPSLAVKDPRVLDKLLDETVTDRKVPAVFFGATTSKGEIYFKGQGERIFDQPDKGQVQDDTIMQIFSTTKLITSLVDQGKLSLHDPDLVAKICPELARVQILQGYDDQGKEILVQPKNKITLNMLLNHTSGLAYSFNDANIARWNTEHGVDLFGRHGRKAKIEDYMSPLVFEPGTRYKYSIGIDWAGFIVERVSGQSLEEYFQQHIFRPCGMTDTSFHVPADYEQRKFGMCTRRKDSGEIFCPVDGDTSGAVMDFIPRTFDNTQIGPVYSGGGGLFGTAKDYLRFLRAILAAGKEDTKDPLISKSSFDVLFTNTLNSEHMEAIQADLVKVAAGQDCYDEAALEDNGKHLAYSPGLLVNFRESKFGRSAMSGCWDGAARTMYWLDPAKDVAGVCFTNMFVPSPDYWNRVYNSFERTLYDSLTPEGSA